MGDELRSYDSLVLELGIRNVGALTREGCQWTSLGGFGIFLAAAVTSAFGRKGRHLGAVKTLRGFRFHLKFECGA